ncbi:hypothetical protein D3C87_1541620 [compost metagenome]
MRRSPPSLTRMTSALAMKSNSISNPSAPCGMSPVVSPRADTRSVTCQPWFSQGVCDSRTLPTICAHSCNVSIVGHSRAADSSGHASARAAILSLLACPLPQRHARRDRCMREGSVPEADLRNVG